MQQKYCNKSLQGACTAAHAEALPSVQSTLQWPVSVTCSDDESVSACLHATELQEAVCWPNYTSCYAGEHEGSQSWQSHPAFSNIWLQPLKLPAYPAKAYAAVAMCIRKHLPQQRHAEMQRPLLCIDPPCCAQHWSRHLQTQVRCAKHWLSCSQMRGLLHLQILDAGRAHPTAVCRLCCRRQRFAALSRRLPCSLPWAGHEAERSRCLCVAGKLPAEHRMLPCPQQGPVAVTTPRLAPRQPYHNLVPAAACSLTRCVFQYIQ